MLLGSLFELKEFKSGEGAVNAILGINEHHDIFKGHFPGQPILPGVCMMQVTKELIEKALQKKLIIAEGDNIKFLAVIDPNQTPEVNAQVSYTQSNDNVSINASLFAGNVTFFKLKAVLKSA